MMHLATLLLLATTTVALKVQERDVASAQDAVVVNGTAEPDNGKAIFYSVIMGTKYTRRHQVSLWLSSLRLQKMGNWGGEAIIVTDKPKCLEKTLEETKMIGKLISSNEFVDIFEPPEGMKGTLHIVKRPHTGNVLKIKLEKARAWINTRNAGIEGKIGMIVYTDEDIVMGQDVNAFVQEATSYAPNKHTLALFRDTGKSAGELHTGVVVIYNYPHSEECLRQWGMHLTGLDIYGDGGAAKLADKDEFAKETANTDADTEINTDESDADTDENVEQMDAGTKEELMGPDQQALGRTKQCMAASDHLGIQIMPRNYFMFPYPKAMKESQRKPFIHFTNTGRWLIFSNTMINEYLTSIGVPDYIDPLGHSHSEECAETYQAADSR